MNTVSGIKRTAIRITPCIGPCGGQSCCNCCGEAPAMHKTGWKYIPFQRYDKICCFRCRCDTPENCMHLQGKTRAEWLNELPELPKEGENDEL